MLLFFCPRQKSCEDIKQQDMLVKKQRKKVLTSINVIWYYEIPTAKKWWKKYRWKKFLKKLLTSRKTYDILSKLPMTTTVRQEGGKLLNVRDEP